MKGSIDPFICAMTSIFMIRLRSLVHPHPCHLRIPLHTTDRRLDVVGGFKRMSRQTFSSPREFRPLTPPIVRPEFLARDNSVCGKLKTDAILGIRPAIAVAMAPLTNLGIAFHLESELTHAQTQLRNRHCAGRGEVLVEVHTASLVAFAPSGKEQML